ncbi:unnamed protein product [Rhizophagus irregularis]|nr:unnamed protein product [Rhizophagus irregularis]
MAFFYNPPNVISHSLIVQFLNKKKRYCNLEFHHVTPDFLRYWIQIDTCIQLLVFQVINLTTNFTQDSEVAYLPKANGLLLLKCHFLR